MTSLAKSRFDRRRRRRSANGRRAATSRTGNGNIVGPAIAITFPTSTSSSVGRRRTKTRIALIWMTWIALMESPLQSASANGLTPEMNAMRSDEQRRVRAGSTVVLPCLTNGVAPYNARRGDVIHRVSHSIAIDHSDTAFHYEWLKDDEPLSAPPAISGVGEETGNTHDVTESGSRYSTDPFDGTLTIHNVSSATDTGVYSCVRRQLADQTGRYRSRSWPNAGVKKHIQLVVEDVPEAPVDVHWTVCDSRVVQLHWSLHSENYCPVQQFVVEYNTSFDPDVWRPARAQIPRDARYYRIALSPWADYSFRVVAENAVGRSRPSQSTAEKCTTPPDVPHIHPRAVCTRNGKPHTLVITWELMPLIEHNAPGFYYIVKWRRLPTAPDGSHVTTSSAVQSDDVDAADHLLPLSADYDGELPPEFEERTIDATTNSLTIASQPVYKPYEIYVLAANDVGEAASDPVPVIGFSSEDEPLEVPQNFRIDPNKPITNTTADFVWDSVDTSPQRMHGFFRGYKIQYWKTVEGRSTTKEHIIVYAEPTPCLSMASYDSAPAAEQHAARSGESARNHHRARVTSSSHGHVFNLWPATSITARVIALNGEYEGAPSVAVMFTTGEGVPGAVEAFRVANVTSPYVTVAWNPPLETNGNLVGYQLAVTELPSMLDSVSLKVVIEDPAQTSFRLTGLRPVRLYRLSVCAATSVGCGPATFIEITTPHNGPPVVPKFTTTSVSKRGLNVTWFPSIEGSHYQQGTLFSVHYRKLDEMPWKMSAEEKWPTSWTLIEGLSPEVNYQMKVVAWYGDGANGAKSSSQVERVRINYMKRDVPEPLYKSVNDENSSATLEVRLANPAVNAPIESYFVKYRRHGSNNWQRADPVPRDQGAVIKHLERGRKYDIQVVTRSEHGETTGVIHVIVAGTEPTAQASVAVKSAGKSSPLWTRATPINIAVVMFFGRTVFLRCLQRGR